jgi:NADP-dependent aldehyde dehydrogenase
MLNGMHLIAGEWLGSHATFENTPTDGTPDSFAVGTVDLVDAAVCGAEASFPSYCATSAKDRAVFLRKIAQELEARREEITQMGARETGLPLARLNGELGRTTGQLELFASHIETGSHLDLRHDPALPERRPLPRSDLRLVQRAIGPIAVFGASNFPLAFSTAGGDTAAALAAGCPVVVKGHSAHPGTSDLVAQAINAAVQSQGLHPGVFSQIQGGDRAVGQALVQHPLIKAVGFTGSLAGGRTLFDLCASRPEPIPFFGELGSVNPVFVLPSALENRGADIAQGWAASLTMGAGQFCTNPGIAILIKGREADAFVEQSVAALSQVASQTMLTDGIADAYHKGCAQVGRAQGVTTAVSGLATGREAAPSLFQTTGTNFLENHLLGEEVFGPTGVIVVVEDMDEMHKVANALQGQLTCTLQIDAEDHALAKPLVPILERKAGRILFNGFPTGVEVCDSMVHGGPYPASTNFGATSVGTMSIRRFMRPVCYQDMPDDLFPVI